MYEINSVIKAISQGINLVIVMKWLEGFSVCKMQPHQKFLSTEFQKLSKNIKELPLIPGGSFISLYDISR